jgi:hypothetical protein
MKFIYALCSLLFFTLEWYCSVCYINCLGSFEFPFRLDFQSAQEGFYESPTSSLFKIAEMLMVEKNESLWELYKDK